jgi:hypothetical protein
VRRAGGTYWPRLALQPCANLEVPRAQRTSDRFVKIISRYVIREHIGPFLFALTALTSLMILNFISRQFGELVGKGLPSSVIGEFFLLSIPFTIALTLPMSVLVAVLYAFSRLAAENEVTALKARAEPMAARDAGARGGAVHVSVPSRSTARCCRGRTTGSRRCRTTSRRRSRPSCCRG